MNQKDVYYYKQVVDKRREVIELKHCFVDLGNRCPTDSLATSSGESSADESDIETSDEEFRYCGYRSDTESYDSDRDGYNRIVEAVTRQSLVKPDTNGLKDITSSESNSKTTKTTIKSDKMGPKTPATRRTSKRQPRGKFSAVNDSPKVESKPAINVTLDDIEMSSQSLPQKLKTQDVEVLNDIEMPLVADQSLLEDDFYSTNMEYFMSQSMSQSFSQSSGLIQQSGRFAYYPAFGQNDRVSPRDRSSKLRQSMDDVLKPLCDECDDDSDGHCHWSLVLKVLPEYSFAFQYPSPSAIRLAHKMLGHYNWSTDLKDMDVDSESHQLAHYKRTHNLFIGSFTREILLSCYTRPQIMRVLGGSLSDADSLANAWPFVSKMIQFLINESIKKSDQFSLALLHFKRIIELLVTDFRLFITEQSDLSQDILRSDTKDEYPKPLIARLIWPQKTPNYMNSILKQLIFLIKKVIKIKDNELLTEIFKLFELSAECLRVGAGNVRPFVTFAFNKATPITELFQQLSVESLVTNDLMESLIDRSSITWIRQQFCGYFMTKFITDLKTKYINERKKHISLKLIVECLTNAKILSSNPMSHRKSLSSQDICPSVTQTPPSSQSTSGRSSIGKRRSLSRLSAKQRPLGGADNKQWSKRNKYGENGLHIACKKGQSDKLRELLAMSMDGFGLDPNEACFGGYTPLCEAAHYGHIDCVQALIEWQTSADKRLDFAAGPSGQTALHECIENNNVECARLVLDAGGLELLDLRRLTDDQTPADLIRSPEMRQMIDEIKAKANNYRPKISLKSAADSKTFQRVITQLILSYLETTRLACFAPYGPDKWPDIWFDEFDREITDTDMTSLIEDLAVFRFLPQHMSILKSLFADMSTDLIDDLELGLSFVKFYTN